MKWLMTLGMAIVVALVLAACGGSASTSDAAGPGVGSGKTVTVRHLPGEASGKIVCDDAACNAFWKPLILRGGKPTASAGAGKLGVVRRPDGSRQVTVNGRPLYTFAEDSPGKATGDGFTDDFDGHHFIWHIVRAGGITTIGADAGRGGSGPRRASSSGGGYSY